MGFTLLLIIKQNIIEPVNYKKSLRYVNNLPQYKYEIVFISSSKYYNKKASTWLFGVKIFINNNEITKELFPDGFTALINTNPTTIYSFESNENNINVKIIWNNSAINTK